VETSLGDASGETILLILWCLNGAGDDSDGVAP